MHVPQRLTALAIAALLAAPGTALAQSAGDNQYQDPLGNSPSSQNKTTTQKAPTPAPPAAPTPAASPSASAAAGTTTTQNSAQLPRTGLPLIPLAALGVAFIVGGVLVRRLA